MCQAARAEKKIQTSPKVIESKDLKEAEDETIRQI